jgi:hypothetical protein
LNGADLTSAHLDNADLSGSDLSQAILDQSDLSGAVVSSDQISKAKSLMGVIISTPLIPPTSSHTLLEQPLPSTAGPVAAELASIDAEMRAKFGSVDPNCATDTPSASPVNCTQYLWTKFITSTVWANLFSNTHFYLLASRRVMNYESNRSGYQQSYRVIAQEGPQRYMVDTFDQLLHANNIIPSDDNRQAIAQAFVLMSLADYLENQIIVMSWEEGSWSSSLKLPYNYALTVWTKMRGRQFKFLYLFYENHFVMTNGYMAKDQTGDYLDEPPAGTLPWSFQELYFQP